MSEAGSTVRCPRCEHEVPALPYCVRCGEWLVDDLSRHPSGRRGFTAAPHESRLVPNAISTMFPQLPRRDMDLFQFALALGAASIIALALFRLFPLGLVASAVLVPLLVLIYLWDVDLYEDEPLRVLALTIAWGAAAGVGVGFLSRHVVGTSGGLTLTPSTHTLVWSGILIPLIGVALIVAGPLPLLPYRKFNDVLDGVTFGGACAVSFVGAELLTHSSTFLGAGVRPIGLVVPWVLKLIALGTVLPVLAASALGAAIGTLWLRYRAPIRDRNALGPFGHPAVALPLAAGLIVGAALIQLYTRTWLQLFLLLLDALIAVIWLRQLIHVGLLEEASEIPIGAKVRCANCGKETPRHTFCGHCGVSLQALPKSVRPPRAAAEGAPAAPQTRRGLAGTVSRYRFLLLFAGSLATFVAVALVVIELVKPGPPQPPCRPGVPCPGVLPTTSPPLATSKVWHSSLGAQMSYSPYLYTQEGGWKVAKADGRTLELKSQFLDLTVRVAPASEAGPLELSRQRLSDLRAGIPALAADHRERDRITDPTLGSVDGIGSSYAGTTDSAGATVEAMIMAATDGKVSIVASVVTTQSQATTPEYTPWPTLIDADIALNTLRWPTQPAPGGRRR